jgi:amino acid permease
MYVVRKYTCIRMKQKKSAVRFYGQYTTQRKSVKSVRVEKSQNNNMSNSQQQLRDSIDDRNGASETGAVVLLSLTAMGAGVLSLPVTFYYGGWVLGLLILLVFAILADYSLVLIVRCAEMTQQKSILAMARVLYGRRGKMIVMATLLTLLAFAQIAMLIVIGDVLTPAVQYFSTGDVYRASCDNDNGNVYDCHPPSWAGTSLCDESCTLPPFWTSRLAVSIVSTALYFPLSLFDKLKALSASSTFAVVALFGVMVSLCVELGDKGVVDKLTTANPSWQLMMIPSILSCAFCCHFNILEVQREMRPSIRHRIEAVIHKSMLGIVLIIYTLTAMVGYLIFGDRLHDCTDILTCFDSTDKLMLACSVAIGLVNIVKMPLIMIPTRGLFLELYAELRFSLCGSSSSSSSSKDDLESSLLPPARDDDDNDENVDSNNKEKIVPVKLTKALRLGMMLTMCVSNVVLAYLLSDLALGFSVISFTSGMAVCFTIPGALYYAALVRSGISTRAKRIVPLSLLAFGVIMALVALAGTICFVKYN